MNSSRLYIIEGLPCSGKSTTAKFTAEFLSSYNNKVIYIDEGTGKHPADYEFNSFIPDKMLCEFSVGEQKTIIECSQRRSDGYIAELSALKGILFEKVLKYKIYDFLDWETEYPLMLEKWQEFVDNSDNGIFVFNCCLLQNPMCETMMRFGFDIQTSKEYILKICNIIKSMKPSVIYLASSDIEKNILQAVPERGQRWLDDVIDYHINGAYGRTMKLSGFEGYISCLEERQKRELQILNSLPLRSLIIQDAHKDWNNSYNRIREFITDNRL